MPIARFPENIALQDGVHRGDNALQVALWQKGEKPGEYKRIRSARNPEGIEFAPNIVGVAVTISEWKEVVRGFFAKVFGKKEEGTETIPLGNGKTIEVQNMMKGLLHAVLAWGKEAEVVFNAAMIAELFPTNEGHEILGKNGDLCLVHGKEEILAPKRASNVPHSPENDVDPCQRFIDEVEAKFEHRIKLADYPEGTHIPGLECLETEPAKLALAAFREAEKMGISQTELYMPNNAQGIVSIIPQLHSLPQGIDDPVDPDIVLVPKVQSEIFRLLHCLRRHLSNVHVLTEGTPYHKDYWLSEHERISIPGIERIRMQTVPGTRFQVGSPEGQEALCERPEALLQVMEQCRKQNIESYCLLNAIQFPAHRGAELGNLSAMIRECIRIDQEVSRIFSIYYLDIGETYCCNWERHPSNRDIVYINEKAYRRDTVVRDLRRLLSLFHEEMKIHKMREDSVVTRMKENATVVPHLIFGAAHQFAFLSGFAREGLGLLVTKPTTSLEYPLTDLFSQYADEKNPKYAGSLSVLRGLGESLENTALEPPLCITIPLPHAK